MNSSTKRKIRQNGFTVIEVLIVLAIAALILLVVFQAIPQLQRSQQNSARRSEVYRISTAINTFMNDNGGILPGWSSGSWDPAVAGNDAATILSIAGKTVTPIILNSVNNDCTLHPVGSSMSIDRSNCSNGLSVVTAGTITVPDLNYPLYTTCINHPTCGIPQQLGTNRGYQMQIVVGGICDKDTGNPNGVTSVGANSTSSVALQYTLLKKTSSGINSYAYCVNAN